MRVTSSVPGPERERLWPGEEGQIEPGGKDPLLYSSNCILFQGGSGKTLEFVFQIIF